MLDPAQITRNILADKPRVTRFPIDWHAAPGEAGAAAVGADGAGAAEGAMEDDEEMGAVEGDAGAAAGASAGGEVRKRERCLGAHARVHSQAVNTAAVVCWYGCDRSVLPPPPPARSQILPAKQ